METIASADRLVFLNVDPVECQRRIIEERKISSEVAIPLDYLKRLYVNYTKLIFWLKVFSTIQTRVFVVQPP